MNAKMNPKILLLALSIPMGVFSGAAAGEEVKGRILGELCAQRGKIGECYLKWAEPMVLWTEEGDYYAIELTGKDLDQVVLDKAFGREVTIEGEVSEDRVRIDKLTVLNPVGKKEFFKA